MTSYFHSEVIVASYGFRCNFSRKVITRITKFYTVVVDLCSKPVDYRTAMA